MNLVLKKKAEEVVNFEWDNVTFKIRHVGFDKRLLLQENATTKLRGKDEKLDLKKFGQSFTIASIAGWENLTYGDLIEICEPLEDMSEPHTKKIPFSEETLRVIAGCQNQEFMLFITECSNNFAKTLRKAKNVEVKN